MEEKKTVFDYLSQIMVIFGFSMLILNIFCLIFGNSAESISSMFALGNQGIPVEVAFEFLCLSVLITGFRFLFFTDVRIRKMSLRARMLCMLASIIAVIAVFIVMFGWFPIHMWQPWVLFFVCFGISVVGSCLVMTLKETAENRRMEEALERLKDKEKTKNG